MKAALRRWREVIAGGALTGLLLWWTFAAYGAVFWVALAFTLISAGFVLAAVQRARFATTGGGFGAVEVDEGVVSYFTPQGGGQAEIAALTSVMLLPEGDGKAAWLLDAPGQMPLRIPLDAFGADRLFDVFVALDGIETERMLRQIRQAPDSPVVIWRKRTARLH
ncbi:hypothetical protein [Celeribacter indicus]|uniref:hypothetical protein n=1 Tax=Celeribacter indicus TaxID=1208324 RepID=UPI00089815D0|nr:hypothetical protein [Celeribacter indicus]SDW43388.1 hypothetical protein SAMN05443573_103210 [Celeribacter indicus]